MKTLHYRWNRSLNWILTTLLGFLGFSSCEDNGDDPGNIICMYGTVSYTHLDVYKRQKSESLDKKN